MYFDSVQALLEMDGHGAYVWTAYAVSIAVVAVALILPIRRHKALLQQLSAERKRAQSRDISGGNC
jgi:heme exporter protein D